jgi:sugar phosphate permease
MDGIGGKAGWSWIFIIEGLLTIVVAAACPWLLADVPHQAKFLTPEERERAVARVKDDQGSASLDTTFEWGFVWDALKDYHTYCIAVVYWSIGVSLYSVSLFTPTIISELGKWTRAESNLLSTPPFFLAFVTTVGSAFLSDRLRMRGVFNIGWMLLVAVGYIILITTDPVSKPGVSYFAIFLTVAGTCPCSAITISWMGSTFGPVYKRAMAMGFCFTCGNSAGILASLIYVSTDAPHFYKGHGVCLGHAVLAAAMSAFLVWDFRRENKRRDKLYGIAVSSITPESVGPEVYAAQMRRWGLEGKSPAEVARLGDQHPGFRYIA